MSTVGHSTITIRQPKSLKVTIARAAALRGVTVTSFINGMLEIAAERMLRRIDTDHTKRSTTGSTLMNAAGGRKQSLPAMTLDGPASVAGRSACMQMLYGGIRPPSMTSTCC